MFPQNIVITCACQEHHISLVLSAISEILAFVLQYKWQYFVLVMSSNVLHQCHH